MAEVFYRKYRARKFSELIGQDHVVSVLRQALSNNSPAHAYLFSGPRGTGKTSTARLLAKALNCSRFSQTKDVCDECDNCVAVNTGNSLNIIEIDAASNRGINEIRQLREAVSYTNGAGYKVYIIDEVHMLTTEAFNALLKTLEEPPAHVVFVLATTELHKVPATILSRVQHFQFRLGSQEQIKQKLEHILKSEGYTVEPAVIEVLFELAEGGYRDAESLLGKLIDGLAKGTTNITEQDTYTTLGLPAKKQISTLILHLLNVEIGQAMRLVQELEHNGVNWQYVIKMLLSQLKQDIITKLEKAQSTLLEVDLLRSFANLYSQLKDLPSPKLAIETEILLRAKQGESTVAIAQIPRPVVQSTEEDVAATVPANLAVSQPQIKPQSPRAEVAKPITTPSLDFNLDSYTSLVRREHITLPQILKAVKLHWDGAVLTIQPQTAQQLTMLQRSKPALEKHLKGMMGDNAQLNLVDKAYAAPVAKPANKIEEKIKAMQESAQTQADEIKTSKASREHDTSNAKLVEQLF